YKARLVVKGYEQREGIDYDQMFAPVAKFTTIRLLLNIAAMDDMEIHLMDFVTAFLNRDLPEAEAVCMKAPVGAGLPYGSIVKLRRTLYSLKQSARKWNDKLDKYMLSIGFKRGMNDLALYWKTEEDGGKIFVLVYVDD